MQPNESKPNDEFVDVNKIESMIKDEEKELSDSDRLVRIEALLHALITTINKIVDTPDPYEVKMDEILSALNEIKEQNKVIAKSLLAVIKKLQEQGSSQNQNALPPPPPQPPAFPNQNPTLTQQPQQK